MSDPANSPEPQWPILFLALLFALLQPVVEVCKVAWKMIVRPDLRIASDRATEPDLKMVDGRRTWLYRLVGLRLPVSLVERIDRHAERLRKETGLLGVTMTDAATVLLVLGLDSVEKRR